MNRCKIYDSIGVSLLAGIHVKSVKTNCSWTVRKTISLSKVNYMNRKFIHLILFSLGIHFAIFAAFTVSMKTQGFDLGNALGPSFSGPLAVELDPANGPAPSKQISPSQNISKNVSRDTSHDTSTKRENTQPTNLGGSNPSDSAKASSQTSSSNTNKTGTSTQNGGSSGAVAIGSADPYYSEVRTRIQSHVTYSPALARRRLQGQVQVALTLLSNGSISTLDIAHSSGSTDLDHLALESVRAAAPFPTFQATSSARKLELPIDFRLH